MSAARTPRRHRRPVVGAARRAGSHVRLIGLATLAVGAVITYIIILSVNGVPFEKTHTLYVQVRQDTPPLDTAMQVRVAGERAGVVKRAEPTTRGARLRLAITPAYWPLGDRTRAVVRIKPATGLVYLELLPDGHRALREGGTIPASDVSATTSLPQVAEAFDAATRRAMGTGAVVAGAAYAGRGEQVGATITRLRSTIDDGLPLLQALTRKPGRLAQLVSDAGTVAAAVAHDPQRLDGILADGRTLLAAVSRRRSSLAETVERAPGVQADFLAVAPRAERTLARAGDLMDVLDPLTRQTTAMLPAVERLLRTGPTMRQAITTLSPVVQTTLADAPDGLRALRGPMLLLKPTSDALQPTVDTLAEYKTDLIQGVRGLEAVTSKPYAEGVTAPGNPALRFAPILTCHRERNPYPAPGQALRDGGPEAAC